MANGIVVATAGLEANKLHSLVPRSSPASDFDYLQYSKMARKGLGDRITLEGRHTLH